MEFRLIDITNPFTLARASDFTDRQINSLWVELGAAAINTIIEPTSKISKFILGGKGTGKTHLLRYYSYSASRLRTRDSGLSILVKSKFLAIFLRATGIDAARFEASSDVSHKWQQLFGVYLELRLVEGVLDALIDVRNTTPGTEFDDAALIEEIARFVVGARVEDNRTLEQFRDWILVQKRNIDDAVNNAAFTGELNLRIPFSIGSFCVPISRAIGKWNSTLVDLPLLYLIDEIENFSVAQQQVVNSLIRYGEGLATFRVTGRLYSRKTFSTLANGEENREGAEFKTVDLDEILRSYRRYPEFARKFVVKRLASAGVLREDTVEFDPKRCFEEIDTSQFYEIALAKLGIESHPTLLLRSFSQVISPFLIDKPEEISAVATRLIVGFPAVIQRLNILLFCKKLRKGSSYLALAEKLRSDATAFVDGTAIRGAYATAYGHYAGDLFAQICRESKRAIGVPYAGFDTFVRISAGNPRSLLIMLGRAYELAQFKEVDFINSTPLSIQIQTTAFVEAARFTFESDSNYGSQSDLAREAVRRLAEVLRTARFAMKIPEVSPLAISFSEADLDPDAKSVLSNALNYSLVFEIHDGRPDRNTQQRNRKVQLNPILSPRWGLPIARRGDIGLNKELLNAIFAPQQGATFEVLLKKLDSRWNSLFRTAAIDEPQANLFQ